MSSTYVIDRAHVNLKIDTIFAQCVQSFFVCDKSITTVDRMAYNEEHVIRALSTEIRMELVSHGWSQQELAAKVGITRESMSRYLSGKKEMPMSTFIRIADAFGLTSRELMYRAELRVEQEGLTA